MSLRWRRLLCAQNEAGLGGVYEPASEVKQQLRVLEELDRAEQRTREESERTAILRAAKVPVAPQLLPLNCSRISSVQLFVRVQLPPARRVARK